MGRKDDKRSAGKHVLVGIGVSILVVLLSGMLLAYLVHIEKLEPSAGEVIRYPVLILAAAVGSYIAAAGSERRIAVSAAAGAGGFALAMCAAGILFFEGLGKSTMPGVLCILVGYGISCAICIRKGNGRKKRKRLAV